MTITSSPPNGLRVTLSAQWSGHYKQVETELKKWAEAQGASITGPVFTSDPWTVSYDIQFPPGTNLQEQAISLGECVTKVLRDT